MKIKGLMLVVLALLLAVSVALAKGPPQKVTISGEGLDITLTGDQATLDALAFMSLEDTRTITADAPAGISPGGYTITRFYEVSKGSYVPFDQLVYYPNPDSGRGYLYYGGIVGGWSDYDNHWFRPSASGEAALQALIANGRQAQTVMRAGLQSVLLQMCALFTQ